MSQLVKLIVPAGVGLLVAYLTDAEGLETSGTYVSATSVLLAIGLYGSTYSIRLDHARENRRTIVSAVTVGVLLKSLIIGATLALAWQDPLFLVLGVAVAQIDPLSVAAIVNNPRMSERAKSVLAAWSSFDDPVTVIVSVYAAAAVVSLKGMSEADGAALGWDPYGLLANAVFVGAAWIAWRLVRRWPVAVTVLAVVLIGVAVWQFTMLGLAIAGLFVRPDISRQISWAVQVALVGASFMLGMLLTEGVDPVRGAILGVAAFGAQIIVGFALTRRLPAQDRIHLAFAQQNGITAIILALLLESRFDGVIAIVAPAILVINIVHLAANAVIDRGDAAAQGSR